MQQSVTMTRLVVVLLATFVAAEAGACTCPPGGTVEGALKFADIVFAGVVVSIEDPGGDRIRALPAHEQAAAQRGRGGDSWGPEWGRKVEFRVMQWWKSDSSTEETVELWTGYDGGDCGYPVEEEKSYLVFARRTTSNRFSFSICGRTAALVCASDDLEALGEPIKTYETFDTASLAEREQPYTTYWRSCIRGPLLIGERGLKMDKHCGFKVEGVITREGTVRDFRIVSGASFPERCPDSLRRQVTERVAEWRFRPAELDGEPVEVLLETISMRVPVTEADYAKRLREKAEWEAKQKPKRE